MNRTLNWILLPVITGLMICSPARGQDYLFKRYTTSDGLVNEVILDIMEDSHGFLWIGTVSGLSRFDGKDFRNYGYTEGLQNLTVRKTYEDKHHRLWIATSKGIAELRGSRFAMYSHTGPGESAVWNFEDLDGYGLLAFTEVGTFRYDDSVWTKIDLLAGYTKKMCSEVVAADSGFYMNYENAVIYKKKNGKPITLLKDTTDGSEVFCNWVTKKHGKVYAGVQNRLYEITNGKLTVVIDSIPINRFYNFTIDSSGICWVNIFGKGLYRYQLLPAGSKQLSVLSYDSNTGGLPIVDSRGIVWVSTYEGLVQVIPKVFEDLTPPKTSGTSKRLIIVPGVDSDMIVSNSDGLYLLRGGTARRLERPSSYKDEESYGRDVVEGSAKDNRNFTWMITRQRKMLCWNGKKLLDYSHLLVPRSAEYIRNMTINPLNNTVFICDDSTLLCGNEKMFGVYTDNKGNHFSKTTTVLFTHNGIGIVNVFSKGLYFITRRNEIIKAPAELDIVEKGSYTYFFEDKEGWLWISNSGKGLIQFRIDEDNYSVKDLSVWTTAQGLPANKISDMAFDAEGNKWVSCSNGLAVLKHNPSNPAILDVYIIGKEQSIPVTTPLALATDNAGSVWLSSIDKLIRIDTRKLILKKVVPGIVIEKVLLNLKETDWSQHSDSVYSYFQLPVSPYLNYSENTLGLEFSGVSLYNAEHFEYSYQLAPLDKSWSPPSENRVISFVKLSPGSYSFKVRAREMGTAWSRPATFEFTIRRPFWKTWWFMLLEVALLATVIIVVYQTRVQKIKKQAGVQHQLRELEMKALKAQMNPHFIYNALNSIQALIADEKKSEAINYIGTFSRLLRQVLEYADTNVITLEKELQTLRLYVQLESLRLNMDLEYTVTTEDDLLTENEKIPPLILQPFVENALWHGLSRKEGRKILNILVSQDGDNLVCTVEDNGIGRDNAATFKKQYATEFYPSRGINITIKRLVDFNNAPTAPVVYHDLRDSSQNATGTKVVINIRRY